MESKIFSKIVILTKNSNGSITNHEYNDATINITAEYLILGMVKYISGHINSTEYIPINLNDIHKFKTYNII